MGLAGNSSGVRQLVSNGTMTGTSVITSAVFNIQDMSLLSVHLIWTGTPTGTFTVQGSNQYDSTNPNAAADWVSLSLSPAPAAGGSASSALVNLAQLGFAYLRVTYTNSAGSGTLNVYAFGKAL